MTFRRRLHAAFAVAVMALVPLLPAAARADDDAQAEERVSAIDNVFSPVIVRIPVGGTVIWTMEGRAPHTVTADDASFDSGPLDPGQSYAHRFEVEGAFAYHCQLHGGPGAGMSGMVVVGDATIPNATAGVGPGRETPPGLPGPTVRVPQDFPTIQEAVDHAEPGGMVLISPGIYPEEVRVTTPFLVVRGTDRNRVILDGGFTRANAFAVFEADGVALENMTARNYLLNGFYWSGVYGFRGSYLTAYADGQYGVFAYDSQWGQFDHSYASGHPDSGFYIGQCNPCHAVIADVLSENNALGFSGTNAGGDLLIINSEWRDNFAGIVPNTLDSEERPPQHDLVIAGNWVHDNDNAGAPADPLQYPSLGMGILIAGGRDDLVTQNLVEGHDAYGIAILPNIDENVWLSEGNEVRDNVVRSSGRADLALGAPAAGGDCFRGNDFGTSDPPVIEIIHGCGFALATGTGGSPGSTLAALVRFIQAQSGSIEAGDWRNAPAPSPQPGMPDAAGAPPHPAVPETSVPVPFHIRDARRMHVDARESLRRRISVLGFPLATTWWGLIIGLYAYVLPLILYSAWVSIALWDLVRQEAVPNARRIRWMAMVLLVPLLGPVAYFALGRSPIQPSLRLMLVAGGLGIYLLLAVLGSIAGSA